MECPFRLTGLDTLHRLYVAFLPLTLHVNICIELRYSYLNFDFIINDNFYVTHCLSKIV